MCTTIQIAGGQLIEGVDQLFALIGRDKAMFHEGREPTEANECLCHLRVEETARSAGFDCEGGWLDVGADYLWTPKAIMAR